MQRWRDHPKCFSRQLARDDYWAECLDSLEAAEDEAPQATGAPELQTLPAQPAQRRPRRPQPPGWETKEVERQNEDQQRQKQREIERQQREADRQKKEQERQQQAQRQAVLRQAQQAKSERLQQQREEEWQLRRRRLEQQRAEQQRHHQQHWQKQREWRGGDRPLHERHDSLEWDSGRQAFTESQRSARSSTAPKAVPSPKAALTPRAPRALGRFFDTFRYPTHVPCPSPLLLALSYGSPLLLPTPSAFDAAFSKWEASALASGETIELSEMPFPPKLDPAGLVEGGLLRSGQLGSIEEKQRKVLLRTALLRWHPDKWMAVTSRVRKEERADLGRRLSTITQALVEQKDL